jgi:hypothetical protein
VGNFKHLLQTLNGATGASDMAGNAARVAVERRGSSRDTNADICKAKQVSKNGVEKLKTETWNSGFDQLICPEQWSVNRGSLVFSFGGKGVKLSRNNRLIEWFNE